MFFGFFFREKSNYLLTKIWIIFLQKMQFFFNIIFGFEFWRQKSSVIIFLSKSKKRKLVFLSKIKLFFSFFFAKNQFFFRICGILKYFNFFRKNHERDPLIEGGIARETMVTSTGRNGNSKTTLAKDSAVWKKSLSDFQFFF